MQPTEEILEAAAAPTGEPKAAAPIDWFLASDRVV
jgi:hypothetical protein